MSEFPTSSCQLLRLLVVKIPDTNNMKRRIEKNNIKAANKEKKSKTITVVRLDYGEAHQPIEIRITEILPVIQF